MCHIVCLLEPLAHTAVSHASVTLSSPTTRAHRRKPTQSYSASLHSGLQSNDGREKKNAGGATRTPRLLHTSHLPKASGRPSRRPRQRGPTAQSGACTAAARVDHENRPAVGCRIPIACVSVSRRGVSRPAGALWSPVQLRAVRYGGGGCNSSAPSQPPSPSSTFCDPRRVLNRDWQSRIGLLSNHGSSSVYAFEV